METSRFIFSCLGCKVNQAESAFLATELTTQGWRRAIDGESAEAVILMTCAVTSTASRQSRQLARRLIKAYPKARIIAIGCDVQLMSNAYHKNGIETLARSRLMKLIDLLNRRKKNSSSSFYSISNDGPFCLGMRLAGQEHTRGLLKIQDGCDANCAYCIVPIVRGRFRSLSLTKIMTLWHKINQSQTSEVVLTGINLGRWGSDLTPPSTLIELLKNFLTSYPAGPRLRLSSLEVNDVNDKLLALMAAEPRICSHLHIPLQTGSDRLLKAMGRPYSSLLYAKRLNDAWATLPGLCLGADVIAGLPGEEQIDYENTRKLIFSLPLAYLHVFPYSPRPGTSAAIMSQQVPRHIVRHRTAELRAISATKYLAFLRAQIGLRQWAILEKNNLARMENYCLSRVETTLNRGSKILIEPLDIEQTPNGPLLKSKIL